MDEFAQSRDDDSLFGDEFEAVPTPTIIQDSDKTAETVINHHGDAATATTEGANQARNTTEGHSKGGRQSSSTQNPVHGREQARGHQEVDRSRGRGRGGGRGRGRGGLAGSRFATQSTSTAAPSQPEINPAETSNASSTRTITPDDAIKEKVTAYDDTSPTQQPITGTKPPTQPSSQSQNTRTTAVRGDRSLTGGPQHTKLTEEELTAKLAKMAILNAEKAEKFRRTEADSAAFQQKEAELKKKRSEELKIAREMDRERARNRERKLKAQGGREWDVEKLESDIVDGKSRGRTSEYVRGGHGGVIKRGAAVGLGGSRFADSDGLLEGTNQSQRGRGGFEGRGRGNRGRGRGERSTPTNRATPTSPSIDAEFPALPTPVTKSPKADRPVKVPSPQNVIHSSGAEKGNQEWAEEMATPVEEKNMSV